MALCWRLVLTLCMTLCAVYPSLEGGLWDQMTGYFTTRQPPAPPSVKVLIVHGSDRVNVGVEGKYSIYDPKDHSYISSRYIGKRRDVEAMRDGLRWGEAFPGLYQFKIILDEPAAYVTVDGMHYSGAVSVYDVEGTISIVNDVLIEDYVGSILSSQADLSLEPETLAALAIVVRTNAYYLSQNPRTSYWAIDGSQTHFEGLIETPSNVQGELNMTRGMILSRTGVYEKIATPFLAQFDDASMTLHRGAENARITLAQANAMAKEGAHAAEILAKAFPKSNILMLPERGR